MSDFIFILLILMYVCLCIYVVCQIAMLYLRIYCNINLSQAEYELATNDCIAPQR